MACAIPSLVRNCRLRSIILALLELFLEPTFESFPSRGALLALRTQLGEHRLEFRAARRITQPRLAAGLTYQLNECAQAFGRDFIAPLTHGLWQQPAPRRARERRQQVRATLLNTFETHIGGRIEARAATFDYP